MLNTPNYYVNINGMKLDSVLLLKNPSPTPLKADLSIISGRWKKRQFAGETGVPGSEFLGFLLFFPTPTPARPKSL